MGSSETFVTTMCSPPRWIGRRLQCFIARLFRAAANGTDAMVYGDGLQVRDYVYVDDVVAGLILAWRRQVREPVVIGSGTSTSVLDLCELVRSVTGRPLGAVEIESPR